MSKNNNIIEDIANAEYQHGFESNIDQEFIPKGLNEDIIRLISKKKEFLNLVKLITFGNTEQDLVDHVQKFTMIEVKSMDAESPIVRLVVIATDL